VPTDYKGVSELGMISGVSMFIGLAVSKLIDGITNKQAKAMTKVLMRMVFL
jgi:hypothetical protein